MSLGINNQQTSWTTIGQKKQQETPPAPRAVEANATVAHASSSPSVGMSSTGGSSACSFSAIA